MMLNFGIHLPIFATGTIGLSAAVAVAIWARRSSSAFATAMSFALLIVFLFSTLAFVNYYFFAAVCLAISLIDFDAAKSAATSGDEPLYSST